MQSTPKQPNSYSVLNPHDREEIMIGLRRNESIRSIARHLNRQPSVISREIKANTTEDGKYQCYWAQKRSERRRRQSRKRTRIPDQEIRNYIQVNLETGWSPEQIAGRLSIDLPGKKVSHETIYMYIYKKERSLIDYLARGHRKRRKRVCIRGKRHLIPDRNGIENRPESINTRGEYGHWEVDTAVSRQSKAALMVLQERTLGITLLQKLPRCAPAEMNAAIIERLQDLPKQMRQSITYDNGQENRYHKELCDVLNVATYFCNPYSSWEKGSVENAVGLTRRFWPKKTDYTLISTEEIVNVEYLLNTRPRKRFGYLSPYEMAESVAFTA